MLLMKSKNIFESILLSCMRKMYFAQPFQIVSYGCYPKVLSWFFDIWTSKNYHSRHLENWMKWIDQIFNFMREPEISFSEFFHQYWYFFLIKNRYNNEMLLKDNLHCWYRLWPIPDLCCYIQVWIIQWLTSIFIYNMTISLTIFEHKRIHTNTAHIFPP